LHLDLISGDERTPDLDLLKNELAEVTLTRNRRCDGLTRMTKKGIYGGKHPIAPDAPDGAWRNPPRFELARQSGRRNFENTRTLMSVDFLK
jgi:hypothetical protein